MKITRRQLRNLIFEASMDDQYMLSDEDKKILIQRVMSMPSFTALQRAEEENYLDPMFSNALIEAIKQERYRALRRVGGDGSRNRRGSFPQLFVRDDSSYASSEYDQRSRDKATKAFRSLGLNISRVHSTAGSFNLVAQMFPAIAKEVADDYENFIKYPEKYKGAGFGDRSFLQKAGSFLSGKGFRE